MDESPHFWGFFEEFCPYLWIQSFKFFEISYLSQAEHYLTPGEKCVSRTNLVLAVY